MTGADLPPGALDAASYWRNRVPMCTVLQQVLGEASAQVLEIASGSGQHGPYFCAAMKNLIWWPSDMGEAELRSIDVWRAREDTGRVRAPLRIDVTSGKWRAGQMADARPSDLPERFDAILSMNMVHISPWETSEGLFEGAGHVLKSGAPLMLYGPFRHGGRHTAPSNAAFDASLRARDPRWGVRDAEALQAHAARHGLKLDEIIRMPANNETLLFRRL